jgi:hypothetical protein
MVTNETCETLAAVRLISLAQVLIQKRKVADANQVEKTAQGAGVVSSHNTRRMECRAGVAFL